MAGLVIGIATISTAGPLTEGVWRVTGAVVLAPQGDTDAAVALIRGFLVYRTARKSQVTSGRR